MKVVLLAFNGLMRGEMEIPKVVPLMHLIMDRPTPRIATVADDFVATDVLDMKRATFELESALYHGGERLKVYYRMVDVK